MVIVTSNVWVYSRCLGILVSLPLISILKWQFNWHFFKSSPALCMCVRISPVPHSECWQLSSCHVVCLSVRVLDRSVTVCPHMSLLHSPPSQDPLSLLFSSPHLSGDPICMPLGAAKPHIMLRSTGKSAEEIHLVVFLWRLESPPHLRSPSTSSSSSASSTTNLEDCPWDTANQLTLLKLILLKLTLLQLTS